MEDKSAVIIDTPFLNAFIFALKSWKEDPDEAQVVLGENQEMLTFADPTMPIARRKPICRSGSGVSSK